MTTHRHPLFLAFIGACSFGIFACARDGRRGGNLFVDSSVFVGSHQITAALVDEYLATKTAPDLIAPICAHAPLGVERDLVFALTDCVDIRRDGDSLVVEGRHVERYALRVGSRGDTTEIVAHQAFGTSEAFGRALPRDVLAAMGDSANQGRVVDTLEAHVRSRALVARGIRPGPADSLVVKPDTDWQLVRDGATGTEFRVPPSWVATYATQFDACTPATPRASQSLLSLADDDTVPRVPPAPFSVRRGSEVDAISANGFQITPWGIGSGGRTASGGTAYQRRGTTWIALTGEYWVGHYAPAGGLLGQESTNITFGTADLGNGCRLVFADQGDGVADLDTLATVLSTVRIRR